MVINHMMRGALACTLAWRTGVVQRLTEQVFEEAERAHRESFRNH